MRARQVRPGLLVVAAVVAVAAVAFPVGSRALEQRTERIVAEMRSVAEGVQIPVGVQVRDRQDCRGDGGLVACWSSPQEPAVLAQAFEGALSRSARQPSRMTCETLPYGRKPFSCLVRYDRSGHAVLVSIDSDVRTDPDGSRHNTGSVLRIDSS